MRARLLGTTDRFGHAGSLSYSPIAVSAVTVHSHLHSPAILCLPHQYIYLRPTPRLFFDFALACAPPDVISVTRIPR